MVDDELRRELLRRVAVDQDAIKQSPPSRGSEPQDAWADVRTDNTEWLKGVISEHGWPGASLVGEPGAEGAWLLAQHSDHDLEFQRSCLEMLRQAVQDGEAKAWCLAYLTDRVRVAEGHQQVFGTQYTDNAGSWEPYPIEEPGELDQRRAAVGLEPHAEYDQLMRAKP
ncbi:DUF6624 domain-containing protein [Actinomadura harenae]|uniref:Uncharacterized protein n=1 Tax=Actinomadura harenae TaxID=2483351 RepID=A0A3M2LNU3_9ACTN|nr:DUF6624 domain-containing protein [Actinomadura harenae]RMI39022.1 hypothetical protein EBO15_31140 [Actinomadura harenae]